MSDRVYIGTEHGEISLEEWSAQLARFPEHADRAVSSALKSEGWRLQRIIKLAIQMGAPPGERWPKLNPHTGVLNRAKKQWVRNYKLSRKGRKKGEEARRIYREQMLSTRLNPLSKLAGATRYVYDGMIKTVTIGFLAQRMRGLAKMHARGFETAVTPRMRKWAFALGFPLKRDTAKLTTPPRPVIGPVFDAEKVNIRRNVAFKSLDNLTRYLAGKYQMEKAA
jgi:hypothetical protein